MFELVMICTVVALAMVWAKLSVDIDQLKIKVDVLDEELARYKEVKAQHDANFQKDMCCAISNLRNQKE